ncbi:MAG: hypothetical protein Q4G58_05170 [bacterium]|nr:hypothetical protein [bacterium]
MRDFFWALTLFVLSVALIIVSVQYLLKDLKASKKKETNPELVEDDIEALNDKDTIEQEEKDKEEEEDNTYPFKGIAIGMLVASIANVILKIGFKTDILSQVYVFGIIGGFVIGKYIEKKH